MLGSTESVSLGTIIYASVKPMFKIYAIIIMGIYLAKKNILTVATCRDISDCIVTAIMPCLIFENVVTNLKSSDIKNLGIIFFTGTLLFAIGCLLALVTKYVTKSPNRWFGGLLSVGLFPNISDLPIAYLQTFSKGGHIFTQKQGNLGVAYVCIFLASQIFYQFSLGLYRLIEWDFRDELLEDEHEKDLESKLEKESLNGTSPGMAPEYGDGSSIAMSSTSMNQSDTGSNNTQEDSSGTGNYHNSSEAEPEDPHNEFLRKHESYNLRALRMRKTNSAQTGRRYSDGQSSADTGFYSTATRTSDLRRQKSQDINNLIHEYSERNEWRQSSHAESNESNDYESVRLDQVQVLKKNQSRDPKWAKFKSRMIITLKNFAAPNSVSLIISIAIAMSPPLKPLFVNTGYDIPNAPDFQPPLSFIMDIASYVGAASVPLGLLLLGATISRLLIKKMPPGFWKTALMITASRLILIPIIGVGITTGFYKAGWYGQDKLIRFVSVIEFGLPNATALVYFTAFYTDPNSEDHLQMDCLAICLICQYAILFITLPFLVSFTLKVSLSM